MALGSFSVGEVRPTGNDLNGGFFNAAGTNAGTDYSQQDNPVLTKTDFVTSNSTTVTSASGGFTTALNRNCLNLGGSIYEIVGVPNATTLNLDRVVSGSASGLSGRIGGALATPGRAVVVNSATVRIWVKYGEYTTTTTTANTSGGPVALNNTSNIFEGYDAIRGDRARKPVMIAHAASMTLWAATSTTSLTHFVNLAASGANLATTTGFAAGTRGITIDCDAINCTTAGFTSSSIRCFARDCAVGFSNVQGYHNVALNCTNSFALCNVSSCIALGSSGYGFSFGQNGTGGAYNCLANSCAQGFVQGGAFPKMLGCLSANSSTKGYNSNATGGAFNALGFVNYGSYNDAANDTTPTVTCTADPFVNSGATIASVADAFAAFALNSAAGGGSLLKSINSGAFGFPDIGPVQHQDAGGGNASLGSIFGSSIIRAGGRTN